MEKKIKVNGTTWILKLISEDEMEEVAGNDETTGLCVADDKIIYFISDELSYPTVKHELYHAYASDLHLRDTNDIELNDIEEIFAAMFTDKAEKIISQAKRVYKALVKLKEQNDEK
jgi:hypothetical protein